MERQLRSLFVRSVVLVSEGEEGGNLFGQQKCSFGVIISLNRFGMFTNCYSLIADLLPRQSCADHKSAST